MNTTDQNTPFNSSENTIRVLEHGQSCWDVINQVIDSGLQEEAFYVLDVNDIVRKHEEWKLKLPRVTPFYGKK